MSERTGITAFGKIVILLVVAACLGAAYYFFFRARPTTGATGVERPSPVAATDAPSQAPPPLPAAAAGTVWDEVRRRGALVVGYEGNSPPMSFLDASRRLTGFEHDLALRLAAAMGVPRVEFFDAPYQELPDRLRDRSVDVVIAGYVPDPSIAGVEWSDGYLDFGLCLIVLKSSAVTEPTHLRGKTVGVYDDPAAVRWVEENIPGATVRSYDGETGWFEAVERREVDALVYDYPFAAHEIKSHPRTKIVKFNLNQSRYAVGLLAGNDPLLDAVNAGLAKVMASPEYGELVRSFLQYETDEMKRPVIGDRPSYVVQAGDTLSKVAAARLGSSERWEEIWQLNRERVANPHLIFPGLVLLMP